MTTLALLDIGPIELLLLVAAAVMLFGGDLPDVARRAGRVLGKLRSTARELSRQIDVPPDIDDLPGRPGHGFPRPRSTPPGELKPPAPKEPPAALPGAAADGEPKTPAPPDDGSPAAT